MYCQDNSLIISLGYLDNRIYNWDLFMSKSNKNKRHFMEDSFETYRKIRKPMPKPSKAILTKVDEISNNRKFDWRDALEDND
jgi:hypothetical protein